MLGLQLHVPKELTLTSSLIGSDSTVMVKVAPSGPSPKNSGFEEVIISPSSRLCRDTGFSSGAGVASLVTSNPEVGAVSLGGETLDLGISPSSEEGRFLKSWICPKIMGGTGFAASG